MTLSKEPRTSSRQPGCLWDGDNCLCSASRSLGHARRLLEQSAELQAVSPATHRGGCFQLPKPDCRCSLSFKAISEASAPWSLQTSLSFSVPGLASSTMRREGPGEPLLATAYPASDCNLILTSRKPLCSPRGTAWHCPERQNRLSAPRQSSTAACVTAGWVRCLSPNPKSAVSSSFPSSNHSLPHLLFDLEKK